MVRVKLGDPANVAVRRRVSKSQGNSAIPCRLGANDRLAFGIEERNFVAHGLLSSAAEKLERFFEPTGRII